MLPIRITFQTTEQGSQQKTIAQVECATRANIMAQALAKTVEKIAIVRVIGQDGLPICIFNDDLMDE